MEHDEMSLAENFAGSNTDEDEIDSDLEDKLYAAVFHSNDVSKTNQENITTLNDVISSWKNIPNNETNESTVQIEPLSENGKTAEKSSEGSEPLGLADAGRYESFVSKNKSNDRKERTIDEQSGSPRIGGAKKRKNSPKSWSFKDIAMFDDTPLHSPVRNDIGDETVNLTTAAPENTSAEHSEIKYEEEGGENPVEKERRIPEFENTISAVEGSIKPEEERETEEILKLKESGKVQPAGNGSLNSSSDGSLNFSPEEDEEPLKIRPAWKGRSAVIMIEDSEDSIFEIPIPPKPIPPTIYLDDTESATSSESESEPETETMSPQKLVEDYKLAVSESAKSLRAKGRPEATKHTSDSSSSDSDDSTTESEEEDWGIIAGSQINKDKPIPVADEIVEEFATNSPKIGGGDRSKEPETAETDTLIINAKSAKSPDDIGSELLPRTPENRKRSISDSGKKSKQHSPKKAKSSEDAVASTSGVDSRKDNKENRRERERNCAADYFFRPMTTEMENYYNKSWGGENFDLDAIRRDMPRDPRQWAILNEDLLGNQQRKSRYWTESKCRNCNHTGHHMADCPEKRKLPSCHMCGTQGHREPRCPHKMCLGCGKKQKTYMQVCNGCRRAWCDRCQSYGHVEDTCPDLWRRYHLTTTFRDDTPQANATDVMKPVHMLSCCNCAQRGHDSTTCNNYRWSRHFPTPAFVTNYTTGPTYPRDTLITDLDYSSETREETETERSATSGDGKRRKSSATDDNSPTVSRRDADEAIERPREQSKEPNKALDEVETPLDARKGGDILFEHKSPLVDAEFERAANFGTYTVFLSRAQCACLVESDLSREFLMNLLSQFPIKLDIRNCTDGRAKMRIRSTCDLHGPIQLTIMDWLKWPADERSRFVNLNLPTTKNELIKLLTEKLEELNQYLGDPMVLNNTVIALKSELKRLQRQSESGQKLSTCSRRARVVEELAKSQCKLNMILMGQTNVKSSKFLRITLSEMLKPGSSSYINAATYLQIVHHYNIVFSAYTAENVPSLLNNYFQKNNIKSVQRGTKDTVYNNFLKLLNPLNKNSNSSPASAGSNVSPAKPRKQTPKEKTSRVSPFNGSLHFRSRVRTPERGSEDPNAAHGPSLPPEPVPLMFDLDRLENNYYNSRYNFGDNSSQRHGGGEKNRGQEDYIALDGRSLRNNHYNVEKDWSNAVVSDFNKRSRRRHRNRSMPRNGANDPLENGFPNYQGYASPGNNIWHDDYVRRNASLKNILLHDNQPERSGHPNFLRDSNRGDVLPWGDRHALDTNYPSTSTSASTSNSNIFGNKRSSVGDGVDQPKSNSNKSKKKKKNKGAKLSPYLQKRAAKNIAKYMDLGVQRITQAAKELQKKVSEKQITLQCVQKFEGLVKRKLKRTDYLL